MQQVVELICHPDTPSASITTVAVELCMTDAGKALLTFSISPAHTLVVPRPASPVRTDGLWQHSCCELFLKSGDGEGYFEFNLSPSGQWAAYAFAGYRGGMCNLMLPIDPHIEAERVAEAFVLTANVDLAAILTGIVRLNLTAVIEEAGGTKSYWALAHPSEKPDFHHPDGFILQLPDPTGFNA